MSHPAGLEIQALLYAAGEMELDEAAGFEARLADDQQAREALVSAVVLLSPLSRTLRPGLGYRKRVRSELTRLCSRPLRGQLQGSRRANRSRPILSALAGAAAASLLFMLAGAPWGRPSANVPAGLPAPGPATSAESKEAVDFADMSNISRLIKVRDEEAGRRRRIEERKSRPPFFDMLRPMMPPGQSSMM